MAKKVKAEVIGKKAKSTKTHVITSGISLGSALAMILSYSSNSSILLAIVHGILSWIYVIYFIIAYRLF